MTRKELIKKLASLGERQLEKETEAFLILQNYLIDNSVEFKVQEYKTEIPKYERCFLKVDGGEIDVLPSGLISGTLNSNHTLLSSLISSQKNLYDVNINFNPACDFISRSNHYFAPAFSIKKKDVQKVVDAQSIYGELEVTKTPHTSRNILVGNTLNPKNIVLSHYDSIGPGAVDNASGTVLSLELITENKEVLGDTLFVLCGNEELSYDEPVYWGRGYRCFETQYSPLLKSAEQILVLDSFGHTAPVLFSDMRTLMLAFPLREITLYAPKTKIIAGDIDSLMQFYHAPNDTLENITDSYFGEAKDMTLKALQS